MQRIMITIIRLRFTLWMMNKRIWTASHDILIITNKNCIATQHLTIKGSNHQTYIEYLENN